VGKHGAKLRGWWATESDGDASQMPYVPNGMKVSTTTTSTTTTTTTTTTITTSTSAAAFHSNNSYSHAPQCYVTCTSPFLFIFCTFQCFMSMRARFSHLFFAQNIYHKHTTD
jgi:hypothetical protein